MVKSGKSETVTISAADLERMIAERVRNAIADQGKRERAAKGLRREAFKVSRLSILPPVEREAKRNVVAVAVHPLPAPLGRIEGRAIMVRKGSEMVCRLSVGHACMTSARGNTAEGSTGADALKLAQARRAARERFEGAMLEALAAEYDRLAPSHAFVEAVADAGDDETLDAGDE